MFDPHHVVIAAVWTHSARCPISRGSRQREGTSSASIASAGSHAVLTGPLGARRASQRLQRVEIQLLHFHRR